MTKAGGRRVSVVICTLNEEKVLARVIRSVAWADEVVIVDSGSTDGTVAMAMALGAQVTEHRWMGFSAQKNLAASLARNDWVLSLDADEVVTERLAEAIMSAMRLGPDPSVGFHSARQGDFLGALLPNTNRRRRPMIRLYNRRVSSWDESMRVHEQVRGFSRIVRLQGSILHLNGLDMTQYFELFNRYATSEAVALHANGRTVTIAGVLLRTVARFVWHAVVLREISLGSRGLLHAGLKGVSEFMRYSKLMEIQSKSAWVEDCTAARGGVAADLAKRP